MAYKIFGVAPNEIAGETLLSGILGCYDTIDDPAFNLDRDECLHERSACELVRDDLTDAQRAELAQVDAYWQAHPDAFNAAFAVFHYQEDKTRALAGFIADENGNVPPIPRDHWWWRPIGADEK